MLGQGCVHWNLSSPANHSGYVSIFDLQYILCLDCVWLNIHMLSNWIPSMTLRTAQQHIYCHFVWRWLECEISFSSNQESQGTLQDSTIGGVETCCRRYWTQLGMKDYLQSIARSEPGQAFPFHSIGLWFAPACLQHLSTCDSSSNQSGHQIWRLGHPEDANRRYHWNPICEGAWELRVVDGSCCSILIGWY